MVSSTQQRRNMRRYHPNTLRVPTARPISARKDARSRPTGPMRGGSVFMPLMAGFMMGQMMGGRAYTQPLYRSRDDSKNFRTANNRSVGAAVGRTQVSERAAARPAQKLYTQQRGGFGARARTTGFRAGA